jgi:hypothetical protein
MLPETLLATLLVISSPVAAQRLIAFDSNRTVYEIDIQTGLRQQLGVVSINTAAVAAATYDIQAGKLYVSSTVTDTLYVVDVTDWRAVPVGPYGGTAISVHGLEWDASSGTLFGMSSHDGGLYRISTSNGAANLIGTTGLSVFHNLCHDVVQNQMWMVNAVTASLYSIDRTTAAVTLVGPLNGPVNANGLAYDIDNQRVHLVCNYTDTLYRVDTATGSAAPIGAPGGGNLIALVYVPGNGRLVRAAHGCSATNIAVTGHPNAGYSIAATVRDAMGLPVIGYGTTALGISFCGCTIGHDWLVAVPGAASGFAIPNLPSVVGMQVFVQGLDLLGAGGCSGLQLTLTDTIEVTIG